MRSTRRGFLRQSAAGTVAGCLSCAVGEAAAPPTGAASAQPAPPPASAITVRETTDLRQPQLPPGENAMSRRYLRMLEKWIPVGVKYFAPWPVRPNCGHFFGGAHWYGQETAFCAAALAAASLSPEYDEKAAGVTRADLKRMAIQAVRYLAFTHDTGPADCVRPAVGLGRRENCGTKWGERGKGFFRESQCGSTVAILGRICLMLRDDVDDETWMMVARIHEDYAERFAAMEPKSGMYRDTQMEENAWTSAGLTSCHLFLSRHKKAEAWEAAARRWTFCACTVPEDAQDRGSVGRATAAALAGKTFTALPDYWAENHGMVHPSYTATSLWNVVVVGGHLKLWGRDLPPELLWNRRRVYENLKAVTDGGGYYQAVQGMDWHYLLMTTAEIPHAVAAVLFDDPEAAALQQRGLRMAELRQEANGGRLYDKALAEKAHDQQDPMIMREIGIFVAAELYLFHRLFGPGAQPLPEEELERRLRGVRVFPHAGFVHHRHLRGQTSFSWRNSIMVLPLTREGIYTIAPRSGTWLGQPKVNGRPESLRLASLRVLEGDDHFAAAMVMDRCQGAIRQQVLVASLPDGRLLSWERFVARKELVLGALDQGFLSITNETFPNLGPNSRGIRRLYRPDGSTDYRGLLGDSPSDDRVDVLGKPCWLNVDDRLGLCFRGPGKAVYHNRHYHRPYRAIADELVLSRLPPEQSLRAGQALRPLAALLTPGQCHTETSQVRLDVLEGPDATACLACEGFLACANFTESSRLCVFARDRPAVVPAYIGATVEVAGGRMSCILSLDASSPALVRAACALRVEGDVRIDATPSGGVYVRNLGQQPARVEASDGRSKDAPLRLLPGEVKAIEA